MHREPIGFAAEMMEREAVEAMRAGLEQPEIQSREDAKGTRTKLAQIQAIAKRKQATALRHDCCSFSWACVGCVGRSWRAFVDFRCPFVMGRPRRDREGKYGTLFGLQ